MVTSDIIKHKIIELFSSSFLCLNHTVAKNIKPSLQVWEFETVAVSISFEAVINRIKMGVFEAVINRIKMGVLLTLHSRRLTPSMAVTVNLPQTRLCRLLHLCLCPCPYLEFSSYFQMQSISYQMIRKEDTAIYC